MKRDYREDRAKTQWLNAFPRIRKKYLNQCVVCQEVGYDPIKFTAAERLGIKLYLPKFFHPLEINEIGICTDCARRMTEPGRPPSARKEN